MKTATKSPKVKLTKNETWCPLFPGFYNTIFEYNHEIEFEHGYADFEKLPWKEQQRRYREHEERVSLVWAKEVETRLNKLGITCRIKFETVQNPKEYNFVNDSLNVSIAFDKEQLFKYIVKNKKKLAQYFTDKYTSRDGFSSFYSPDIEAWISVYFNEMKKKPNVLGSILEGILASQPNFDMYELVETVYCNV